MPWVYDPHSGGEKIPNNVKERTKDRILKHAEKLYDGKYERLNIRFRKQFCYIDAYVMPDIPDDFPPPDFPETREEYIERVSNVPYIFSVFVILERMTDGVWLFISTVMRNTSHVYLIMVLFMVHQKKLLM